jgi:hypothetical protein
MTYGSLPLMMGRWLAYACVLAGMAWGLCSWYWQRLLSRWGLFWYGRCERCNEPIAKPRGFWVAASLWRYRGWCDRCGEEHWRRVAPIRFNEWLAARRREEREAWREFTASMDRRNRPHETGRVGAISGVQAELPGSGVPERFGTGLRPKE